MSLLLLPAGASAQIPSAALDTNGDGRSVLSCVGDSNTSASFNARLFGGGWCERLAVLGAGEHEIHNFGEGGGIIACEAPYLESSAEYQILRAASVASDVVVMSFITNDVRRALANACVSLHHRRVTRLVSEQRLAREIVRRLRRLHRVDPGMHLVILLAPPLLPPHEQPARHSERIREVNAWIARSLAGRDWATVIDHPLLEPEDYDPDGLHLGKGGHHKRALAVWRALARLAERLAGKRALRTG